ncbi:MAG: ParA family protein [Candidatus Eisenbacteria sp.]|nr:ParA family protein [Candidatus Eisenbacteria bacterium]
MPRIIAVCNQKGGVGKTTTVINIGACLAQLGARVLLVDVDPQANCTNGVGVDPRGLKHTLFDVLVQPDKFKIFRMEDIIIKTEWPNLDLVPGHPDLAGAELHLVRKIGRETLLRKTLEPVSRPYDYILIDTPPSLSLLTINALTAAQEVVIPSRAEPWSLDGIENLLDTMDAIREELNQPLRIAGIIVTILHERARLSKEIVKRAEQDERLRGRFFKTRIRRNIKLVESADRGIPVIHLAPESHGAKAFMALAKDLAGLDEPADTLPPEEPQTAENTAQQYDLVPVGDLS